MASNTAVVYTSYVLDARRKWKVRCESDDHIILFVQAANMFCDELWNLEGDELVTYKTGEVVDSHAGLQQHRYYMYLKEGESYTFDPSFDEESMNCRTPPGRPVLDSKNRPFPAKAISVYRDLIVNKKYLEKNYLDGMDLATVQLLVPIDTRVVFQILQRSNPEITRGEFDEAVGYIMMHAM